MEGRYRMSYFYATLNQPFSEMLYLEKIFDELAAPLDKYEVSHERFCVTNYEQEKTVQDIVIRHHRSGSWVMLIGMPVLKGTHASDRQHFIERFLADYSAAIASDLDGHFALLAYDALKQCVVAATDANSFIPIFYTTDERGALFSSSELALAKLQQAEIDPLGFSQAVSLGSTWNERTRFQQISKLLPCEIVTIDADKCLQRERYWEPHEETVWQGNLDAVLDQWMPRLSHAVQMFYDQSTEKETVWTDITAGEDARLVLSQCQALGLPYKARVGGFPGSHDIALACHLAQAAKFDLAVEPYDLLTEQQVMEHAHDITLSTDGYGSFFYWGTRFATDLQKKPHVYDHLHLSGMPGGEAFRGTYYHRAKLLRPSRATHFDYPFFTRFKYLLDYVPGLLQMPSDDFLDVVYHAVRESLDAVDGFPSGTQVDHLLRQFQTCLWGLSRRKPFYHPLGTQQMTRSIYALSPEVKRGGKLTRACTERLFPQLARLKTQNGVPTIRYNLMRTPLFLPEYMSEAKKISNGLMRRLYHVRQNSKSLAGIHRSDVHQAAIHSLLHHRPYSDWLESAHSMLTGPLYNAERLHTVLHEAKSGNCRHVDLLGRMINQELACRYVNSDLA